MPSSQAIERRRDEEHITTKQHNRHKKIMQHWNPLWISEHCDKIANHYKITVYNMDVMRQTARTAANRIMVNNFASLCLHNGTEWRLLSQSFPEIWLLTIVFRCQACCGPNFNFLLLWLHITIEHLTLTFVSEISSEKKCITHCDEGPWQSFQTLASQLKKTTLNNKGSNKSKKKD